MLHVDRILIAFVHDPFAEGLPGIVPYRVIRFYLLIGHRLIAVMRAAEDIHFVDKEMNDAIGKSLHLFMGNRKPP